jgi:hypothetical protein
MLLVIIKEMQKLLKKIKHLSILMINLKKKLSFSKLSKYKAFKKLIMAKNIL